MAEHQLGRRVGAFLSATQTEVSLLGYGVHEGEFIVPKDVNEFLHTTSTPVPRIKLDNGDVIWGCECYWGDEEKVKKHVSNLTIKNVSISEHRSK